MNINSSLVNELRQKDYRDAYVASQIRIGLPFQIRALRSARGWSQEEFARRVGMSQPRVSEMERAGERRLNIETLVRVAVAFDVGLQIRFVPFSELVEWSESVSPDAFTASSFDEEIADLAKKTVRTQAISLPRRLAEIEQFDQTQKQLANHQLVTTAITGMKIPSARSTLNDAMSFSRDIHGFVFRGANNFPSIDQGAASFISRYEWARAQDYYMEQIRTKELFDLKYEEMRYGRASS